MKPLRNSIHKFLKSAEVTFFEGLYRDYFTRTLFFAQQYLPDPEEAREIAQETFVTLWEKRTEIRPDLSVQPSGNPQKGQRQRISQRFLQLL